MLNRLPIQIVDYTLNIYRDTYRYGIHIILYMLDCCRLFVCIMCIYTQPDWSFNRVLNDSNSIHTIQYVYICVSLSDGDCVFVCLCLYMRYIYTLVLYNQAIVILLTCRKSSHVKWLQFAIHYLLKRNQMQNNRAENRLQFEWIEENSPVNFV